MDGAIVERAAPTPEMKGAIRLQLRYPDFTTASTLAAAIENTFGKRQNLAVAESSGTVRVTIPPEFQGREVQFIAEMENVQLNVQRKAKVVVNERTGTIVFGGDIVLRPATILHGALTVDVQTDYSVSQPLPFSQGNTQIVPEVKVNVAEEKARALTLPKGATVELLVRALTGIGATARDVIGILQAMKAGGALDAEIELI
jgi:flagellar P-ring protein precursor FlgI